MIRCTTALFLLTIGCADKDDSTAPALAFGANGGGSSTDETGCIRINGSGSYTTINAAIEAASNGDVITLCAGEYDERVIIDKAVSIKGPASGSPATINGPSDNSTVSVRSDNVELSRVTINAPGTGVYVGEFDSVSLKVLNFAATGDTAIRATGSTNILVQASNFSALDHGVIHLDEGGSMRVVNCAFEGIAGYATRVRTGATLSLEGNDFFDIKEDEDGRNAPARATDGAYLYSSGNTFSGHTGAAISAFESLVQSSGDEFTGGSHAISSNGGPVSVDQATITHPTVTGIHANATDANVSITNSSIIADPATNALAGSDAWTRSRAAEGVGIYASAIETVTLDAITVSGFNHGGIYLFRGGPDTLLAEVRNVDLTNIGWHGIYASDVDATLTDVSVTSIRVSEAVSDTLCTQVGEYGGATFIDSLVDWQSGGVSTSGGIGIAGLQSTLAFTGVTVEENACAGIMNFEGTLSVTDSDFSVASPHELGASIVSYQATDSSVTNSRFFDSAPVRPYQSVDTGTTTEVSYKRMGADFQAWYGGTHIVDGNAFGTGARSVYGNEAELTVSNNTWSDYSEYGALIVGGHLTFSDNTFTASAGHLFACIDGSVTASGSHAHDTIIGTDRYTEVYDDGAGSLEEEREPYAYSTVYAEGCDTTWDGMQFTDTIALIATIYGGSHNFTDLDVTRPNTGFYTNSAIEVADMWTKIVSGMIETRVAETHLSITGGVITDTNFGGGIKHTGSRSDAAEVVSSLTLDSVSISETGNSGISVSDVNVVLTESSVTSSSGSGVMVTDGTLTMSGGTIDQAFGYGVRLFQTDAVIELATLQNNTIDGIYAFGASLMASSNTIKSNEGSGIQLSGVTANLVGNNITDNFGYGLICGESVFLACDNVFLGNASGATDTCDASCLDDVIDEDTGATPTDEDTGDAPVDGDTGDSDGTDDTDSVDSGSASIDTGDPSSSEDSGESSDTDVGVDTGAVTASPTEG